MPSRALPNLALQAFFSLGEDGWNDEMDLNLLTLSAMCQAVVLDKVSAEPGVPADGEIYLLDETEPTNPNKIAIRDNGAWVYVTPDEGWMVYNQFAGYIEQFDGLVWAELATGGGALEVQDDTVQILAAATALNFTGSGVTVTDAGGGVANIAIPGGGAGVPKYAIVEHQEALNTNGGTLTAGTFETRKITTELADTIGLTLAANVITLPAGTYLVLGSVPFFRCNKGIARLYDVTNASVLLYGTQVFADSGTDGSSDNSDFYGIITLADTTDIRLESRVETTAATNGAGTAFNVGDVEHYARLQFIDVASWGGGGAVSSETITEAGAAANLLDANKNKFQRWTAVGAKTLTVQPDATEAITQDAEFHIRNAAASDDLTLVAGGGVTINPPAGGTLVLNPGMTVTLKRVAIDNFDLIGQTA